MGNLYGRVSEHGGCVSLVYNHAVLVESACDPGLVILDPEASESGGQRVTRP